MLAYHERSFPIPASLCDNRGLLGVPDTFALFMDLAGEHAALLGIGIEELLERGLYWLTVRTRVRFHRRPRLLEPVTAATFPEKPGGIRANRSYTLRAGEELLIEGKTEWAISETATGRLVRPAEVFPPELQYLDPVLQEPYMRVNGDFAAAPEVSRHTVRATEIDMGQHMNNVAYLYALADCFPTAEWNALALREVEVAFRAPVFEGEALSWRRRDEVGQIALAALRGEQVVFLARLTPEGAAC
ncbi:MAG: acyl-[acyl-carrier-protein] thioesterase [bacterium]